MGSQYQIKVMNLLPVQNTTSLIILLVTTVRWPHQHNLGLAPNVAEDKYWIEYKTVAKKTWPLHSLVKQFYIFKYFLTRFYFIAKFYRKLIILIRSSLAIFAGLPGASRRCIASSLNYLVMIFVLSSFTPIRLLFLILSVRKTWRVQVCPYLFQSNWAIRVEESGDWC